MKKKDKGLSPFDFLNAITDTKVNLFDGERALMEAAQPDSVSKAYVPFMVNRGLSYHQDCVLVANEMNRAANLPPKMQFDFLKGIIRKRRRFAKWAKKAPDDRYIEAIKKLYGYSSAKAHEVFPIFTDKQLEEILRMTSEGGK